MNRQKLRNRNIRGLFTVLILCIIYAGNVAFAEENVKEVKLESSQSKTINSDMKNISDTSNISLATDNPDIAGISYEEMIVKRNGEGSSTTKLADNNIIFSGQQLKYIFSDKDMEKGAWVTDVSICAKRKGTANITLTIDNSGVVTTQVYHVTVKGTKPTFGKKLLNSFGSVTCTCIGESISLEMSTSNYANVTMSCNKENAIVVHTTQYDEKDNAITKKINLGKTKKEIPVTNGYEFVPKKAGNLKITINVEQDGKTYTRNYKLDVIKYKNPFKSFVIAGKDYARYFDKKRIVSDKPQKDGKKISAADCERTQGAKFKIKWKKGYKVKKITYRKVNEWTEPHTLKKDSTHLPKSFWELYIIYSDSKGRTWTNCFYF